MDERKPAGRWKWAALILAVYALLVTAGVLFLLFRTGYVYTLLTDPEPPEWKTGTDYQYASGRNICILGDSIETEEIGGWSLYLRERVSFAGYANLAEYGITMSQFGSGNQAICSEKRIAGIPKDTDLILIGGGTNDFRANVPMGDPTDEQGERKTFAGSIHWMIRTLREQRPDAEVVFLCNPCAVFPEASNFIDPEGIVNYLGYTMADYAGTMRTICEKQGVGYIPVFEESGIDYTSYRQFLRYEVFEDGEQLWTHPNVKGAELILGTVLNWLEETGAVSAAAE